VQPPAQYFFPAFHHRRPPSFEREFVHDTGQADCGSAGKPAACGSRSQAGGQADRRGRTFQSQPCSPAPQRGQAGAGGTAWSPGHPAASAHSKRVARSCRRIQQYQRQGAPGLHLRASCAVRSSTMAVGHPLPFSPVYQPLSHSPVPGRFCHRQRARAGPCSRNCRLQNSPSNFRIGCA